MQKSYIFALIFSFIALIPSAHATLSIPSGLSDGEQELVLQILGFGTSFRPVDNPYPLGGYSGVELGLSFSNIPTGDIGHFGDKAAVDRNVLYPQLTLGKGIFDSVDLFFNFSPYNENTGIGVYSGALRWGFFQATFVPACFSLLVHGTNTNFNNVLITQTMGVDLISGVNVDPFSFYVGAGSLYGMGQFDSSITTSRTKRNQVGRTFHTILGMNIALGEMFLAMEVDSYNTTVATAKFGARF
ncbi:MAG: hypothetical protein SGI74_11550 [Oligoflexia bacterium]|nr:hypothetical protein [Oligoflexia bacterium]